MLLSAGLVSYHMGGKAKRGGDGSYSVNVAGVPYKVWTRWSNSGDMEVQYQAGDGPKSRWMGTPDLMVANYALAQQIMTQF